MILSVGLTPTVQRTLRFARFVPGEVNRAREVVVTASGKGANVARVVTLLGGTARLVQICGGASGRFVEGELTRQGVACITVWDEDDAPTRTCTTLLPDNGPTTELVEEARPVGAHDLSLLRAAISTGLLEAHALCLSGSLPPGVPPTLYADLLADAHRLGVVALVDTQKAPLAAALAARPFLVKPNLEEAQATLSLPATSDPWADAQEAATRLVAAGATWALVSMGKGGALLFGGTDYWRITPPTLPHVVNPIGSGDSLAAGLLFAHIERGLPVPEAAAFGTACAAANCLTLTSGVVDTGEVERLRGGVRLERI